MRYNEVVQEFNTFVRKFPNNIAASLFGFERKSLFESQEGAETAPTVSFE